MKKHEIETFAKKGAFEYLTGYLENSGANRKFSAAEVLEIMERGYKRNKEELEDLNGAMREDREAIKNV